MWYGDYSIQHFLDNLKKIHIYNNVVDNNNFTSSIALIVGDIVFIQFDTGKAIQDTSFMKNLFSLKDEFKFLAPKKYLPIFTLNGTSDISLTIQLDKNGVFKSFIPSRNYNGISLYGTVIYIR